MATASPAHPSPDARIVRAKLTHAEPISALHRLSFDEPWSPYTLRQVLGMPGAFGLLAVPDGDASDGRLAPDSLAAPDLYGFALVRRTVEECELLSLAVAPSRRGQGYGRKLLEAVIASARELAATSLFLEVAEDNAVAQALYRSAGFRPVGRRPGYYRRPKGPPMAALTLALAL